MYNGKLYMFICLILIIISFLLLGKPTFLSILTGLYPTTKGHAILNGFDIKTQREQVYMSIGICPQHDILWDDLTVGEHLLFYARLNQARNVKR